MAESSSKRILIVEDQKEKSQKIRECLTNTLPSHEIIETNTVLVAGQLISFGTEYAGIVLDLAFQRTHQVGSHLTRPFLAGLEIMQQLNEMRLNWPVIIATQHLSFSSAKYGDFESMDDLREMLTLAFPNNYKDLIEVNFERGEWRNKLAEATLRYFI
jgi:CheY-like chemotaxis protein